MTLTDFKEKKDITHAEPTSPAVHLSPDPEKTPRMDDGATQDPAEESTASANLKGQKAFYQVQSIEGSVAGE